MGPFSDTRDFRFRPVTAQDRALLAEWIARPHVAEWFGDVDEEVSAIMDELGAPWFACAIVRHEGRDVGYVQRYGTDLEPAGSWPEQAPGTVGIDQFIAEPGLLGRGVGTALVRQVSDALLVEGAAAVILDPDPANARAVRCYEKAGFRHVGPATKPWGRVLVMRRDGPDSSALQRNA